MTGRHAHELRTAVGMSDAGAAVLAAVSAYLVRFQLLASWVPVVGRTDVLPGRYLSALPAAVLLLLLAASTAGMYDIRRAVRVPAPADVLRMSGFGAAALATVALLYWREFQYSRAVILTAAALFGPFALAGRAVALGALRRRDAVRTGRALLVGGGGPAAALEGALRREGWPAVQIAAVLPLGEDAAWPAARRLTSLDEACAELDSRRLQEVYVAVPAEHAAEIPAILARLEQTTADVRLVPDLGAALVVNPGAAIVGGVPVVSLRERPLYGLHAATKRALDIALAAALLVLLLPLLAAVALIVKASSRGPLFYRQERMGLDGRSFRMLKFRTMRDGAEDVTGPVFARPGDPRTTAAGRVLRRFSLDELPQLWNVFCGDMSLVGPRPERAPFIEEFRRRLPGYMLRHTVRAGMTGWAQVHGLRGESSLEDRLRYDLEYVDRWSLSLDFEILGRTVWHVLAGRNAY